MSELFKTVKKTAIITPDGVEHATAENAQKHLLAGFFAKSTDVQTVVEANLVAGLAANLAAYIITGKSELLAIIGKAPRKARTPKPVAIPPAPGERPIAPARGSRKP